MTTTSPPRSRRSRAAVAAFVLDAIAGVGLLLVAVGAFVRGDALGLVFLGALTGSAAIPGAVLSAVVVARRSRARGMGMAPTGLIIAVLCLCAVAVGPTVLLLSWNATPNPADDVLRPLEQQVDAIGARQVCANGDPGKGPDNTSPWREAYFTVPNAPTLVQRLSDRAATQGFTLRQTTTTDSASADTRTYTGSRTGGDGRQVVVTVEIAPTSIPLRCGDDYGGTFRPAAGQVVVDLSSTIGLGE